MARATARDLALLRALVNGDTPRGLDRDVERLNGLLGEQCVNRAHPLHESPYLFLQRHMNATKDPSLVVQDFLRNHNKNGSRH